jgi:hypothetical protein
MTTNAHSAQLAECLPNSARAADLVFSPEPATDLTHRSQTDHLNPNRHLRRGPHSQPIRHSRPAVASPPGLLRDRYVPTTTQLQLNGLASAAVAIPTIAVPASRAVAAPLTTAFLSLFIPSFFLRDHPYRSSHGGGDPGSR